MKRRLLVLAALPVLSAAFVGCDAVGPDVCGCPPECIHGAVTLVLP